MIDLNCLLVDALDIRLKLPHIFQYNNITIDMKIKPCIKWAGGKRSIMSQIIKYFPDKITNYFEPFAGGLSVLLELYNNKNIVGNIYISMII